MKSDRLAEILAAGFDLELAVLAFCTLVAAVRGDWHAMMATAMLISKVAKPQPGGDA